MTLTESHFLIEDHVEAAVVARLSTESISAIAFGSLTENATERVSVQFEPGAVDGEHKAATNAEETRFVHIHYPDGTLTVNIRTPYAYDDGRAMLAKIRRILCNDKISELNALLDLTTYIGEIVETSCSFEKNDAEMSYSYTLQYRVNMCLKNAVETPDEPLSTDPAPTDATVFTYADKDLLESLYDYIRQSVPATPDANGEEGQIAGDENFLYRYQSGRWQRFPIDPTWT